MISDEIRDVASVMEAKAAELRSLADQVEAIEDQPPPNNAELDAALATIASLQAQLAACQAALADCQSGGNTPPTGNPLRVRLPMFNDRGFEVTLLQALTGWAVLTPSGAHVAHGGAVTPDALGIYTLDFVGQLLPGEQARVIVWVDDGATEAADAAIDSGAFRVVVEAQP